MSEREEVIPFDDSDADLLAMIDEETRALDSSSAEGAEILDGVRAAVTKYVILPSPEAVTAVTLWIVATHAVSVLEHATRLAIHSPVKRCGKSRMLEVIAGLAHAPLETTNISVPALFRVIDSADEHPPTLILDEADRIFGTAKKDEDAAALVALLNNGFRRGSPTWRCVGPRQVPTPFSNFAFAAIAGIGKLPDTVQDRAVNITMRRRLAGEQVAKFRLRTDLPRLHDMRERIIGWSTANLDAIERAVRDERTVPQQLEDRQQDAWEPLCAVAAVAGGDWPQLARASAIRLTGEAMDADGEESLDLRLLSDVRTVFDTIPQTFVPTAVLIEHLRKLDESPWDDFDFSARRLSMRLGKFGVKPRRNTTGTERGYYRSDLRDPFARYLPSEASEASETAPEQGKLSDAF